MLQTTLKQLRAVPADRPEQVANKWKGVPHADLLDAFRAEFKRRGWKADGLRIHLSARGELLVAGWDSIIAPMMSARGCLGIVNSNDWKTLNGAFRAYPGYRIGDVSIPLHEHRMGRHTTGLDLPDVIRGGCDKADEVWGTGAPVLVRLESTPITEAWAEGYFCKAAGRKLLPWSHIATALDDFNRRREKNVWGLLLAFATTMRDRRPNPVRQLIGTWQFLKMLSQEKRR